MIFLNIFLSFLFISVQCDPIDYETAFGQQKLVENEQLLIQALLEYKTELEEIIRSIKNYTTTYSSTVLRPLKQKCLHKLFQDMSIFDEDKLSLEISKSPLMILQLLQRLGISLPFINEQSKKHKKAESKLRHFLSSSGPILKVGSSDLITRMEALVYLFFVYDFQADDLETGRIVQKETKSGIGARHLNDFGILALKMGFFTFALNYFYNGHQMMRHVQGETALKNILRSRMERAATIHDTMFERSNRSMPFLFEEKVAPAVKNCSKTYKWRQLNRGPLPFPEYIAKFSDLCRGNEKAHDDIKNQDSPPRKCFLYNKVHPFWILSPLKVEVHSRDPLVLQFYDIITDSQIEILKSQTDSRLLRSKVVNEEGATTTQLSRNSASVFINESPELTRKVGLATGLRTQIKDVDAEPLQVANYATAGHFVPHLDPLLSTEDITDPKLIADVKRTGDRIATFMFYLSHVEQGGRTAFPLIGLGVEPMKNSALFWYNLHTNGTLDRRTMHGGCSVVMGTKWMATKWIRSNSQMFSHKCDSHQKSSWFYDNYGFE